MNWIWGLLLFVELAIIVFVFKVMNEKCISLQNQLNDEKERHNYEMTYLKMEAEDKVKEAQLKANTEIQREKNNASEEIRKSRENAEVQIKAIRESTTEEIRKVIENSEQEIRNLKEYIESRRKILMSTDEKSLLVDIVMALDGYGNRMERVEEKLVNDKLIQKMSDLTNRVETQITSTTETLVNRIHQVTNSMELRIGEFGKELDKKLDNVQNNIDRTLSSTDVSYALNDVKSSVDRLDLIVKKIEKEFYDEYAYSDGTLRAKVNELESAIDDVKTVVDDIKNTSDKSDDDRIIRKLEDIEWRLLNMS